MLEGGIGAVAVFRRAEKHGQEISGIAELVVGINKRHAERVAVGEGCNGGHLSDEAVGLLLA